MRLADARRWKKQPPSCGACDELLEHYISGARAHANATEELKALLDAGLYDQFAAMLKVTGDVRERCEMARRAFRAHRKRHKPQEFGFTEMRSTPVLRGTRRADSVVKASPADAPSPSAADVEVVNSGR
jgi:hypothetical protein